MKISDMIRELSIVMSKEGDLECSTLTPDFFNENHPRWQTVLRVVAIDRHCRIR